MSLSSPASCAAEMNFQSRYPRGIVVTMTCLASLVPVCVLVTWLLLSCPNEGAPSTQLRLLRLQLRRTIMQFVSWLPPLAKRRRFDRWNRAMLVIPRMNAELEADHTDFSSDRSAPGCRPSVGDLRAIF